MPNEEEKNPQEQPLQSDSKGGGQPAGQETKPAEPKPVEQPDYSTKTLQELFGDKLPAELKNFATKTIVDVAGAKKEADKKITQFTQGYYPEYGYPQGQYYQQAQPQQQTQQEEEELDAVTEPTKFKQKIIEDAKKEIIKEVIPWMQSVSTPLVEQTHDYVANYYGSDFEEHDEDIRRVMREYIRNDPPSIQMQKLTSPKAWVDAYVIAKNEREGFPSKSQPSGTETVNPTQTEKPTIKSGGEVEPSVDEIERSLDESARTRMKAFWGKDPKKYEVEIKKLWKEIGGGKL